MIQGWERLGTSGGTGRQAQERWEEGPARLTIVEWVHIPLGVTT